MDIKADATLDCVGTYCPMPVVKTTLALEEMKPGQVLELVADDPGVKQDIPNWCKMTGNEFLGMEEQGSEVKLYVRKKKE